MEKHIGMWLREKLFPSLEGGNFFSLPHHSYWHNIQVAVLCVGKPFVSQLLFRLMEKKCLSLGCAFTMCSHFINAKNMINPVICRHVV